MTMNTTTDQVYEQCCEAARCLLAGFEAKNRPLIERQIAILRGYLKERDAEIETHSVGQDLLRQEQLDALDAIVEHLEASLKRVRDSEQRCFDRMSQTQPLLEHLSHRWDAASQLPVC